jgi:hypothetical protein
MAAIIDRILPSVLISSETRHGKRQMEVRGTILPCIDLQDDTDANPPFSGTKYISSMIMF